MACPVCKREVPEGAYYCPWCGQKLAIPELTVEEETHSSTSSEETFDQAWRDAEERAQADRNLSDYYQDRFRQFDENRGQFTATWNWASFLFGPFWYIYKGMWGKAALMFIAGAILVGIPAPLFWIYSGLFGNWDYYLLHRRGTQWWA